jgi:hypothetical protein
MSIRTTCIVFAALLAVACARAPSAESASTQTPASPAAASQLDLGVAESSPEPTPSIQRPTPTESLCPPDLEYSVSSYYDEDLNLIMVISSPGQFEVDEIYWCWSEIATQNACTCRPQSDSRVECRVAARENVEQHGFENTALIDVGMGGYSDCRLFYHDLEIPPFPE